MFSGAQLGLPLYMLIYVTHQLIVCGGKDSVQNVRFLLCMSQSSVKGMLPYFLPRVLLML